MIKKQLKSERDMRNTQNRNSLHESIRRSMRQAYEADYGKPAGTTGFARHNSSKVLF